MLKILAVLLAVVAPAASPIVPKTIVTVISSPYCNSLADHFNDALVPMLANDRTLDEVNVHLLDVNTLFQQPDYVSRFLHDRDALRREETVINESLAAINANIVSLRNGAALSTDPKAAAEARNAADDLSTAYDRQRQLGIDLQNMYIAMLRYNIAYAHPAMGGFDPALEREPAAMRDVKTYLHFDAQRSVIAQSEDQAVDVAYAAAQKYCVPKK